jgi:hypothetical protein
MNGIQEVRGSNPLGSTILFLWKNRFQPSKYAGILNI